MEMTAGDGQEDIRVQQTNSGADVCTGNPWTRWSHGGRGAATPRLLPGAPTLSKRLIFVVVNACTVLSMLLGVSAILAGTHDEMRWAALCLLGCIGLDGLDGALARRFGVTSPFGAQLDSLADLCAFGIATPVLAGYWLLGVASVYAVAPACALLAVCAMIRLARFSVTPKNIRFFSGLPAAIPAAIVAGSVQLYTRPAMIYLAFAGVLALLMISTFPYAKFMQLRTFPWWVWPLPVALLLLSPVATVTLIAVGYLLSGPMLWIKEHRGSITPQLSGT